MNLRRVLLLILPSSLLLLSIFVVPASAQPALLVQKTWGGSGNDSGRGVAVDSSGHTYVAGYTYTFGPGSPSRSSISLLKYDAAGSLLWQRIWSGSGNGSEVGESVAVDSSGNIYVTGYTDSFGAGVTDVLLLKFYSNGSLAWQRTWGGSSYDYGQGVAVDASGSVYVTGVTGSFGSNNDVFLLKFNSSGSLQWQRTWGGIGSDYGQGVAVDASGNIYVTGNTNSFGAGSADLLLLKFDSSGSLLFQKTWGGIGSDYGQGVAVDSSGNVYVTGYTNSFGAGGYDALLLKFDPTSALLWQKTWGGSSFDQGLGVAVDASSHIYITGSTNSFGAGADDVLLLKFDSSGSLVFQKTWGGTSTDYGIGVTVDSSGTALVAGFVSEAPPYTLGSTGNNTLGTPAFTPGVPTFTPGTPTFTLHTPTGTAQTPAGSQTYAGGFDEFLITYGTPSAPLSPSGVLITALIATVTVALATRRRRLT